MAARLDIPGELPRQNVNTAANPPRSVARAAEAATPNVRQDPGRAMHAIRHLLNTDDIAMPDIPQETLQDSGTAIAGQHTPNRDCTPSCQEIYPHVARIECHDTDNDCRYRGV